MENKVQAEGATSPQGEAAHPRMTRWAAQARRVGRATAIFLGKRVWQPAKQLFRVVAKATKRGTKRMARVAWVLFRREVWNPSRRWVQMTYAEARPRLAQGLRDIGQQAVTLYRLTRTFWATHRPAFLDDPVAVRVLVLAAGLNLAVWAWLALRYSSLPIFVRLPGNPDRIVLRREVFILPTIGLMVFLVNTGLGGTLYRRLPFASYILFGGATLVQGLLLITVWQILADLS